MQCGVGSLAELGLIGHRHLLAEGGGVVHAILRVQLLRRVRRYTHRVLSCLQGSLHVGLLDGKHVETFVFAAGLDASHDTLALFRSGGCGRDLRSVARRKKLLTAINIIRQTQDLRVVGSHGHVALLLGFVGRWHRHHHLQLLGRIHLRPALVRW